MATKAANSAAKSKDSAKPKSNRGGARPGAGRKPKPVEEIRQALNLSMIQPMPPAVDAATAAMELLRRMMDDVNNAPKDRIAAARELLNRTVGRAREADPPRGDEADEERVHIFMPDNGRDSDSGREAI